MRLSAKNYYTHKNTLLSNSKLKDYLRDPKFFYEKHVLHTRESERTLALDIGQAVDTYVMYGPKTFHKRFKCVARRNLKEPPAGYIELNESDFAMAVGMGEKVRNQPAYADLASFETQKILQVNGPTGPFSGLCGIPDWIKIDGKKCVIVDLKTAQDISPRAYARSCESFGYFMAQAMYQRLAGALYGCTEFESRHLVVEKDKDGIYACKAFVLSQERIEAEKDHLAQILLKIASEKLWASPTASWAEAVELF
jgi:hypothetical protein